MAVFEVQLREFETGGVHFEPGDIVAHSEGTVGWAACRPTVTTSDGGSTALRFTGVWRLDRGVWRSVQSHLSVGATNEAMLGYELTTTIETIAAAVQEERPDLAQDLDADGMVTIAFSDIEGSTDLAVRVGDERWLDLLRWHDGVVAAAVTRQRGRVVKSLGDGHMLAFPSAAGALRAVIDVQEAFRAPYEGERLQLRIGVHAGEVLRHADDFFGRTVIMAARVAAAARGGEVLTSARLVELVGDAGAFAFDAPRTMQLKGMPGEHHLYPLLWDEAASGELRERAREDSNLRPTL
jgi:class 3 adenylate cyclase